MEYLTEVFTISIFLFVGGVFILISSGVTHASKNYYNGNPFWDHGGYQPDGAAPINPIPPKGTARTPFYNDKNFK